MLSIKDYRPIAKENEAIFRNILRDMKNHSNKPRICYLIPSDLDTESSIDKIFEKYSQGDRYGRFSICNFLRPSKTSAIISFQDVACLSGGGAELEYLVKKDNRVKYQKPGMIFIS